MKKNINLILFLFIVLLAAGLFIAKFSHEVAQQENESQFLLSRQSKKIAVNNNASSLSTLEKLLDDQLSQSFDKSIPLEIPTPEPPPPIKQKIEQAPPSERALGRKSREKLPLGVVLYDHVNIYNDPQRKKIGYTMMTSDFVRVFENESTDQMLKIQPGVDIYLKETSKQYEGTGLRFPDAPAWIERDKIHILPPDAALKFTRGLVPITFDKPTFSTVSFYERALKNPDPVVHKVIGPRMLDLFNMHEDYTSSWALLYRDYAPEVRLLTLQSIQTRGLHNDRVIMEDLIRRLAELTKEKAQGAEESEILLIIDILNETRKPRALAVFKSFEESWTGVQSDTVVERLNEILHENNSETAAEESSSIKSE